MPQHVFTYGSLMFATVWQRVVRGGYRCAPAMLADHARYRVRNETYPGLLPQAGARVDGVVYFDLDGADLAALDAFEGEHYRRAPVTVALADGTGVAADTYLYLPAERLSSQPWLPQAFDLQIFMAAHCAPHDPNR